MTPSIDAAYLDFAKLIKATGYVYTPSFSPPQLFRLHHLNLVLCLEPLLDQFHDLDRLDALDDQAKRSLAKIDDSLTVEFAVPGLYQIEIAPDKVRGFREMYGFDRAAEKGIKSKQVGLLFCYGHSNLPTSAFYAAWRSDDTIRHFVLRFEHPFDFDEDEYKT